MVLVIKQRRDLIAQTLGKTNTRGLFYTAAQPRRADTLYTRERMESYVKNPRTKSATAKIVICDGICNRRSPATLVGTTPERPTNVGCSPTKDPRV